ncbi:MAG: N-acetylmuramoyl-L-alanine amidase [Candidatus Omnitrophota bacterium]
MIFKLRRRKNRDGAGLTMLFVRCLAALAATAVLSSCTITHIPGPPPEHSVSTFVPQHLRGDVYHSLAPGETLWRIARMYKVDVESIKNANDIRNVRDLEIGRRLYIPSAAPREHVVTLYPSKKWKYIIIHHSATDRGNSTEFNKAHLKKGWEGIGYQFIIDNGTCGKDDGQIETSPRWTNQTRGAHCKAGEMNEKAIGICLVGNFSRDEVSPRQMDSLVYLVNRLRGYYKIPAKRVLGHGAVQGARTECPGTGFPWKEFKARLR